MTDAEKQKQYVDKWSAFLESRAALIVECGTRGLSWHEIADLVFCDAPQVERIFQACRKLNARAAAQKPR